MEQQPYLQLSCWLLLVYTGAAACGNRYHVSWVHVLQAPQLVLLHTGLVFLARSVLVAALCLGVLA